MGWTSPVMNRLMGITGTHEPLDRPLTLEESSWVSSLLTLGAIFGPLCGGIFIDKLGRKYTLLIMAGLPSILGWILTISAKNYGMLYAARFLIGISTGSASTLGPVYVAEISSALERGALCSLPQLMISLGILLEYAVGPYVSYFALGGINLAVSVIFVVSFFFMPESPYYLIAIGKQEEAEKSLAWCRGERRRVPSSNVLKELEDIADGVTAYGSSSSSLLDSFWGLFSSPGNRKALMIMGALLFTLQFCGINAVLFNAESIFRGKSEDVPILGASESAIVIAVVQVLSSWVETILADRLGRRPLLFFSTIVCGVSLTALGAHDYIASRDASAVSNIEWFPIVSLVFYNIAFTVGLGPLTWAIMGELFSTNSKSAAGILCGCFGWIAGFVVTRTFQPIASSSGTFVAYWIYASCSFAGFLFTAVFLPETKCKTLQEIQRELND
ncbi:hypothetical protein J437_LFUL003414 [Ladona fulva]|uniref:Major facilitator superfamily (MFS) profile domain-containing protein n=1 Tax=Ladona fulva TaxID=123851 RepID=A0A8K0NZI6_LADFU|nr:hypothetical protein J437_LFUL003414 [Ladona fulva]